MPSASIRIGYTADQGVTEVEVDAGQDMPKLGMGLVGLGGAFQITLPSIAAHPFVNIVAAASRRKEARAKIEADFGARAYETLEEMCNDDRVDVIYIASPHEAHAEQAVVAARHGKHIIVEKPMAITMEECQAMVDEAERAGVKLMVGHTSSFDAPILKIREIIHSGELGKLRLINTFHYTDFLYRPRRPEELDTQQGGGIVFNQSAHQVDVVRLIGGGLVRSVRAYTGVWDPARPTEGASTAVLEFEDGAVATIIYSGYAHFDSEEFWGREVKPESYGAARRALARYSTPAEETAAKGVRAYGSPRAQDWRGRPPAKRHEHFGVTIVSCDKGDMRPAYDGVTIYGDDELRHVTLPFGRGGHHRSGVIDEMYDAVVLGKPLLHDGRWGMATLEVCLAMLESSRERREVSLTHQTALAE